MRARDLRTALGLDWGNASPGCVLWGAALPDEHVHIYDELKFQRMTAKDVAAEVKAKCKQWHLPRVPLTYCDPSLLPYKSGELGEWIGVTLSRHGVPVVRVSNDRKNGWQRVHEALAPCTHTTHTPRPWLTIHPRCKYLVRTLPLMVQSENEPEDLDSDSDDHACLVAGTHILTARGEVPIEQMTLQDQVWTPHGWRPVICVAMTAADAEVWAVRLDNGGTITGTANHPFMVLGHEVSLDALCVGDRLTTCLTSPVITAMPVRSGDSWWGRFLPAITSTIKTAIRKIMRSTIWRVSRLRPMPVSTHNTVDGTATLNIWQKCDLVPSRGTAVLLAAPGISDMVETVGPLGNRSASVAWSVSASMPTAPFALTLDSVPTTVSLSGGGAPVSIMSNVAASSVARSFASTNTPPSAPAHGSVGVVSSPRPSGAATVYNLTVEGGVFFANGILVRNCDALRYLLMGGLRAGGQRRQFQPAPQYSLKWYREKFDRPRTGVLS